MKTPLMLASGLAVLALGAGSAVAGGSEGSIGVGAEEILSIDIGPATLRFEALSANYDAGPFHAGGLVGFYDFGGQDDSFVFIGGRFYYHLHSTAMADIGVGATGVMGFLGNGNPNVENDQIFLLEPGLQVRAFVASNVALSIQAGLTLGLMDADGVTISGTPTGAAAVHYYFF